MVRVVGEMVIGEVVFMLEMIDRVEIVVVGGAVVKGGIVVNEVVMVGSMAKVGKMDEWMVVRTVEIGKMRLLVGEELEALGSLFWKSFSLGGAATHVESILPSSLQSTLFLSTWLDCVLIPTGVRMGRRFPLGLLFI